MKFRLLEKDDILNYIVTKFETSSNDGQGQFYILEDGEFINLGIDNPHIAVDDELFNNGLIETNPYISGELILIDTYNAIRGSDGIGIDVEPYVELPANKLSDKQLNSLSNWLYNFTTGNIFIGSRKTRKGKNYAMAVDEVSDILKDINRFYNTGSFGFLAEDYKDRKYLITMFSNAINKYIPSKKAAETMLQGKLKDITEDEWQQVEDWINYLQFPLTIYRGLNLDSKEKVDLNNLGVNWTVDDTLFFERSAFSNCNIILEAVITEDIIDWPETIQNYIYYSLRPNYGFYPEEEITLKKNYKPSQLKDLKVYTKTEFSEVA